MVELKNIQNNNKIYITERFNSLDIILCESLFGKFENKVIVKNDDLDNIIEQYDLVVVSSISKCNTNIIYKKYLNYKFHLFQLDYLDFDETGFDEKKISMFAFYNLEFFRRKNLRNKCLQSINHSLGNIRSLEYKKIFSKDLDYISGEIIFYLYKIFAFNSIDCVRKYCFYLNNLNKELIPSILDSAWRLSNYCESNEKLCQCFIDYFLQIKYSDHQDKEIIFKNLIYFYKKMDGASVSRLSFSLLPIISYCTNYDKKGNYIQLIDDVIEKSFSHSRALIEIGILIDSKIFKNEHYETLFSEKVISPTNKVESIVYDALKKLEVLLQDPSYDHITNYEKQKGVYDYITFIQCNIIPKENSTFFQILSDQKLSIEN